MTTPINDGGPAFPVTEAHGCNAGWPGLSMRDYFAANSLQGFLAGYQTKGFSITPDMQDAIARGMYSMADAMLAARDAA